MTLPRTPVSARTISNARSGFLLLALTVSVFPTELRTGFGPPAMTAGNGEQTKVEVGGSAARIEVRSHWPPQSMAALPVAKIADGVRLLDPDRALDDRVGLDDLLGLLGHLHHLGAGPLELAEVGVTHLGVELQAASDV